jgi:hypothetical protein
LVFKLQHTDFGVHTTNSAEGSFSWMLRGGFRDGYVVGCILRVLKTVPTFLFQSQLTYMARLQEKKVAFAPFYPSASLDKKYSRPSFVKEYVKSSPHAVGCTVQHFLSRRMGVHNVLWPARTTTAAVATATWWLRPATWGGPRSVMCDGTCLRSQREGFACVHVLKGVSDLANEEKLDIFRSSFAPFYQVGHLLSRLLEAQGYAVELPNLANLSAGPRLRSLAKRKVEVQWNAKNGGRRVEEDGDDDDDVAEPVSEEELDRIIADLRPDRIASNGEVEFPQFSSGQRRCKLCGQQGHYQKTCPNPNARPTPPSSRSGAALSSESAESEFDGFASQVQAVQVMEATLKLKRAQLALAAGKLKKSKYGIGY